MHNKKCPHKIIFKLSSAPARRGSNDDFDSYMGNLEQQDSDLLNVSLEMTHTTYIMT